MTKDFLFFQINVPVEFTNRVIFVCVCVIFLPFKSCLMEFPVKMF